MNTKIIMTLCAITLGVAGIVLTFIPDLFLAHLHIEVNSVLVFLLQILGALYFAFGILNWMTRKSLIGGIYNRPIALANFSHFAVAGLALIKGFHFGPDLSYTILATTIVYFVFGVTFGILLFRHPLNDAKENS